MSHLLRFRTTASVTHARQRHPPHARDVLCDVVNDIQIIAMGDPDLLKELAALTNKIATRIIAQQPKEHHGDLPTG